MNDELDEIRKYNYNDDLELSDKLKIYINRFNKICLYSKE